MRIEPTVGRVLWYVASAGDALFSLDARGQPLAAQVAHVHDDGAVNLSIADRDGNHHARQNVRLVQPDEDRPTDQSFCTWMPYQQGQAGKTDDLSPRVSSLESNVGALSSSVSTLNSRVGELATAVASMNADKPASMMGSPSAGGSDGAANSAKPG